MSENECTNSLQHAYAWMGTCWAALGGMAHTVGLAGGRLSEAGPGHQQVHWLKDAARAASQPFTRTKF